MINNPFNNPVGAVSKRSSQIAKAIIDSIKPIKKSCVANLIFNNKGEILLLQRSPNDSFHPSTWCLPGGGVDENENPKTACVRETKEECGLFIPNAYSRKVVQLPEIDIYYFSSMISRDADPFIMLDENEHQKYMFCSPEKWLVMDLILDLKDHLKELMNIDEDTFMLSKSIDNDLEKGGKANIGEIRHRKNGDWVKHADGWVHADSKTGKYHLWNNDTKTEASKKHIDFHKDTIGGEKSTKEHHESKEEGLKDLYKEHVNLVKVLDSPSHKDDKVEAKKQAAERDEYKKEIKEKTQPKTKAEEKKERKILDSDLTILKQAFKKVAPSEHGRFDDENNGDSASLKVFIKQYKAKLRSHGVDPDTLGLKYNSKEKSSGKDLSKVDDDGIEKAFEDLLNNVNDNDIEKGGVGSGRHKSYREGFNKNELSKLSTQKDSPSKMKMAKEVLESMEFLNIPSEKFSELKEKHGGLKELHKYFEDVISGGSDDYNGKSMYYDKEGNEYEAKKKNPDFEDEDEEVEKSVSVDNDLEKGGEGSRGGKVIGHTKSGKAVYQGYHVSSWKKEHGGGMVMTFNHKDSKGNVTHLISKKLSNADFNKHGSLKGQEQKDFATEIYHSDRPTWNKEKNAFEAKKADGDVSKVEGKTSSGKHISHLKEAGDRIHEDYTSKDHYDASEHLKKKGHEHFSNALALKHGSDEYDSHIQEGERLQKLALTHHNLGNAKKRVEADSEYFKNKKSNK